MNCKNSYLWTRPETFIKGKKGEENSEVMERLSTSQAIKDTTIRECRVHKLVQNKPCEAQFLDQ